MESERLPKKMMLKLHDEPIIEWVYKRISLCTKIDKLIFAIPNTSINDLLENYLSNRGAIIVRGSANNLIDRFMSVANTYKPDNIVRICADNPCICHKQVDKLVEFFDESRYDYAYNHAPYGNKYPDGLGAEICTMNTLKEISDKASSVDHKEHLFNYVIENKSEFSIGTFDPEDESLKHPGVKLDIDTWEDYDRLSRLAISSNSSSREIVKAYLNNVIRSST